MTQEEEIAQLKKQLSELVERFSEVVEQLSKAQERESHLLAQLSAMQAENQALQKQLAVAQKHIEELEKQKTPPPAFVKANVASQQKGRRSSARSEMPSTIAPGVAKRRPRWSSIASSTVRCVRVL